VKKGIENMENEIAGKEIKTITDLEAYSAVKERLLEAHYYITLVLDEIEDTETAVYNLAYASERVYSAMSWYEFFKHLGKEFDLNKEKVKQSCQDKIAEAEERYQYVKLLFPALLDDTKQDIDYAYSYFSNKEYELCLFKASMAKAESDIVLNVLGLNENETKELLQTKLEIVRRSIISGSDKGIFPIMAYSYYEYAQSLQETDLYSALLYTEYALELAAFDMYFKAGEQEVSFEIAVDKRIWIFFAGVAVGFAIAFVKKKSSKKRKKKK
jgi:predicted S18 family serine protease